MNVLNPASHFDYYFNDLMSDLTGENIVERTSQIKEIFIIRSSTLIMELQENSREFNHYRRLENRLRKIDPGLAEEIHSYFERIQNIAKCLKEANRNLSDYEKLSLPNDLEQVRLIQNPNLKSYVMAHLYDRDMEKSKIPLSIFSKEELLAMGPYLKNLELIGAEDWDTQIVDELINACPNLRFLNVSYSKIERLPPLLFCRKLICNFCPSLKEISVLPICKDLVCFNCPLLAVLPELFNCAKLICFECPLTALPELPNCKTLMCFSCQLLAALPALPNCKKLECMKCPLLETLPELPNCRHLSCGMCRSLEALPELPKCEHLDCRSCPLLAALPALPNCIRLECRSNKLLELPALPNCRHLTCFDCSLLEELPELPCCIYLDCSKCPQLVLLPELLNCTDLNYSECPMLNMDTVPPEFRPFDILELPVALRPILKVKMDEINQNPLKILLELGDSLIEGEGIPYIQFIEADGQVSDGIDEGGLTNIFLTKIIESLIENSNKRGQLSFDKDPSSIGYMPVLDLKSDAAEDQKKGFSILGALLNECLEQEYLIDRVFHPALFRAITACKSGELTSLTQDNLEDLPNELRFKLLSVISSADNFVKSLNIAPEKLTPKQIQKLQEFISTSNEDEEKSAEILDLDHPGQIQKEAKRLYVNATRGRDTLLPIAIIAEQMLYSQLNGGNTQWEQFCAAGGEAFQQKIEGVLNAELVLKALTWDFSNAPEEETSNTMDFVLQWLEEASPVDLRNFVFTLTGLPSITKETSLQIDLKVRKANQIGMRLPEAHTCHYSLDLPSYYPDYEIFKDKLNILIAQSINKEESGVGLA